MKIKVEEEADKEFVTPTTTSRRADKISEGAGSSAELAKAKPKAKRKAAALAPFDPAVEAAKPQLGKGKGKAAKA